MDGSRVEEQEGDVIGLRPVYQYEPDTRDVNLIHEVVGTTPRGEPKFKPLFLPSFPEDQKIIVEVPTPVGMAEYKPVVGKLTQRVAEGRLKASGYLTVAKPLFVTLVLPSKKQALLAQNYRVMTPEQISAERKPSPKEPSSKLAA